MLRSAVGARVRVLDGRDLDEALAVLARDPVADVFVASRVHAGGLDAWRLGAEVWGYGERGRLESLCYAGANLVPVQATIEAARAYADRARRQGRRCSSIVGPTEAGMEIGRVLSPGWGRARDLRAAQPLLAIQTEPLVAVDDRVRRVRTDEVEVILPACVAMFIEEVGVSPLTGDGGALYRARVTELVAQGKAFARIDDGVVVFKAEIGAATAAVAQVQGVWVHPTLRGKGLGTAGTAAVVAATRTDLAPIVSLYVNDYNLGARKSYEKVGFQQVGTFASVLF